ncbi:MAG: hypothetical protein LBT87_00115, partial [Treponema sp.]|nr:hypothetical protein [Treponema sp.]
MKRNSFWSVIAFMAVTIVLVFSGCEGPVGGGSSSTPDDVDVPAQGIMSQKTAQKIFEYKEENGGVVITKFKSTTDLQEYLKGGTTFTIKEIDGKPVVKIDAGAFAPKTPEGAPTGIPDITEVVTKIELPETIEELGENLFYGADWQDVFVDIPEAVVNKIVEKYIEKMGDDAPQGDTA